MTRGYMASQTLTWNQKQLGQTAIPQRSNGPLFPDTTSGGRGASGSGPVWLMLGSAYVLGGNYQRVIQPLENEELGDIALNIAKIETITVPMMLEKLGLPQPLEASFWVTGVLPAVRREHT